MSYVSSKKNCTKDSLIECGMNAVFGINILPGGLLTPLLESMHGYSNLIKGSHNKRHSIVVVSGRTS